MRTKANERPRRRRRARLPPSLSSGVGQRSRPSRSRRRPPACRRLERHAGPSRLREPDRDRLLRRTGAVLPPSNVPHLLLHELARGIDDSEVVPHRPTQSISLEDTFEQDVLLAETEPMIRSLAERLWSASRKESRTARTVVLKMKTSDFKVLTRSHTASSPPSSCEQFTDIALRLRERGALGPQQRYRLVGVGLSNFQEPNGPAAQPVLFE